MTNRRFLLAFVMGFALIACAIPAHATFQMFICHNHPNGNQNPPPYGLRLDNLINTGAYTFSFDYVDGSGSAGVTLTWDDVTGEIHIYGRAYGGRDTGSGWVTTDQGWIDIDFWYHDLVNKQDDCAGTPGDDAYVTGESANNAGTITLLGWGGNQVFSFSGRAGSTGCAFILDNDTDPKGNTTIAGDPSQYSASGWLQPPTSGSRDWIFVAEMPTVPVQDATWGHLKALYR